MLRTLTAAGMLLVLASCGRLDRVERATFPPSELAGKGRPGTSGYLKAHMPDGSVYLFSDWRLDEEERRITGSGIYFGVDRDTLDQGLLSLAADSVSLFETNVHRTSGKVAYLGVLTAATAVVAGICISNPKACFGSCPTIYSTSESDTTLEAEAFSHSIAPLFEMRDVDRIAAQPDDDGTLRLSVRNEALETHYINHLELLEIEHSPGSFAVPDRHGGAFVLDDFVTLSSVVDRTGRDVTDVLAEADGDAYVTSAEVLARATISDARDTLYVTVPSGAADTVGLYSRFRTSLLSTVLFYDFLLGGQGLRSIEWLSDGLSTIGGAAELGRFYNRWMGIRVAVRDGAAFQDLGRIGGAGPIAWDEAALEIPVPRGGIDVDSVEVRLTFTADAYRIDHLAAATSITRAPQRRIPVARTFDPSDNPSRLDLAHSDQAYVITHPGSAFDVEFDVGAGDNRTFFLAAQGYYIEWIRGGWLRRETDMPPLASDEMVLSAIERWVDVRTDYEDHFFKTRIPVRRAGGPNAARLESDSTAEQAPDSDAHLREDESAPLLHPFNPASVDPAAAEFVAAAREATRPFHRLDAAVAAGYRLVGPDFPDMGEHWVNVRRAMDGNIDPKRPSVLTYLRVDGHPYLTGVAYAAPLRGHEPPPSLPFEVVWHDHAGTVADETLHLSPDTMGHMGGSRLAMFHAWIWTENPDGVFAQQNWALPFLRLGRGLPVRVHSKAAKILHLLSGGVDYYLTLIDRAAVLTGAELEESRAVLETYRRRVGEVVSPEVKWDRSQPALARMWDEMRARILSGIHPAARDRIGSLLD